MPSYLYPVITGVLNLGTVHPGETIGSPTQITFTVPPYINGVDQYDGTDYSIYTGWGATLLDPPGLPVDVVVDPLSTVKITPGTTYTWKDAVLASPVVSYETGINHVGNIQVYGIEVAYGSTILQPEGVYTIEFWAIEGALAASVDVIWTVDNTPPPPPPVGLSRGIWQAGSHPGRMIGNNGVGA